MRKGRSRGDKAGPSALQAPRRLEQPPRAPMDVSERRACPATGGRQDTDEAGRGSAAFRESPEKDVIAEPITLRCRKLSNPDIYSSTGKSKLHRQLSQDDCKLRRGGLASSLSGKQLLPLSTSMHSGVGQSSWQSSGESSNLVRMRNQSLGQSAPSLTAGLGTDVLGSPNPLVPEWTDWGKGQWGFQWDAYLFLPALRPSPKASGFQPMQA
ncbi:UNVERIFIED_CONTAM: Microtubule-associated serine/threonine-protein kinase 2 [Gekko kuhli]